MRAVLGLLCLGFVSSLSIAQVQSSFFGMHVNKLSSMPIEVPIGGMRLWDTGTNWFQVCPSSDYTQCNWERLDSWLAAAKRSGVSEVVYTFGKTPDWASSNANGDCWGARPGACYPPRDLTSDGGGTDEAFRHFVEAIVEHNQRLDARVYAKIRFWGIANEPTVKFFWRGTTAQLVRMAKDASEIIKRADPGALILTPEPAANSRQKATDAAIEFLDEYLSKGGGKYTDVVAFHLYANAVSEHPVPEDVSRIVGRVKEELAKHPEVAGKPLWITECSWGKTEDTNWSREDEASGFLVRFVVMAAWERVARIYWYGWDVPTGTLWWQGRSLPASEAFKGVQKWLIGRSVSNCTDRDHVWSCDLTAGDYRGKIVWDEEYQQSSSYDASGFTTYKLINGTIGGIDSQNHILRVGNSPTLLELKQPVSGRKSNTVSR